ncbi:hypothetical protein DASC09_013930 [Saccharomycopsis crataegensis]|uniref:Kinetochore protein Spc24 n=1 Tax=Saccharomycopsis crataegensis TaxID=43959 RepID=A0AAV5QGU3_9ASCO|nr:hypothetical protein DASC09_013930 [Saccharomycopsis crataegensis]
MLENLSSLLKSTIQNFEIEPDIQIISQINKKISNLQRLRYEKIQQQEQELEKLVNEYELKLNGIQSLELSQERKKILEEINELNNLKFKLARNYLELENEINDLGLQFKKKTQELVDLQNLNILNNELNANPDSNVLKLKIYKNFGLLIETKFKSTTKTNHDNGVKDLTNDSSFLDKINEDYNNEKIHNLVINNNRTNLITTLNIDETDNKLSDYFISNYLWDNL